MELDKMFPKFTWKCKDPKIDKALLKDKTVGGLNCHKKKKKQILKHMFWYKGRQREQGNLPLKWSGHIWSPDLWHKWRTRAVEDTWSFHTWCGDKRTSSKTKNKKLKPCCISFMKK